MKLNNLRKALLTFCCICVVNSASAVNINYETTNLTDLVEGEDLWEYTYIVSDHTFNTGNGFSIFFEHQVYSNLEDPAPPVNGDWSTLVFQPDALLPDDGIYDALSLTNGALLSDPFMISFIWTGNGTPGAQPYETYDATFSSVSSGTTQLSAFSVQSPTPIPTLGSVAIIILSFSLIGVVGSKKKIKLL